MNNPVDRRTNQLKHNLFWWRQLSLSLVRPVMYDVSLSEHNLLHTDSDFDVGVKLERQYVTLTFAGYFCDGTVTDHRDRFGNHLVEFFLQLAFHDVHSWPVDGCYVQFNCRCVF